MKKFIPKFKIGDKVLVKKCLEVKKLFKENHLERLIDYSSKLEIPFRAIVVGYTRCSEGKTFYKRYEDEQNHFECEKVKVVVLIRRAIFGKELMAYEEDLELLVLQDLKIPVNTPSGYIWGERDRNDMKEIMKKAKRDSKGRWLKW